jgi:sarcosine oxidase subunit gamma
MSDLSVMRRAPLAGFAPPAGSAVTLTALSPAARFILRARKAAQDAAAAPLGVALPAIACRAATAGTRAALWLGPDEWLLLAPEAEGTALAAALGTALAGLPHSLVDVGHRQAGLTIAGPHAATALNTGCPLDLDPDAFPIGMCTRTVLSKTQIVLWRTGAERFRVEAWRSFLPYVWDFLTEAAREFSG